MMLKLQKNQFFHRQPYRY